MKAQNLFTHRAQEIASTITHLEAKVEERVDMVSRQEISNIAALLMCSTWAWASRLAVGMIVSLNPCIGSKTG